jgi:hypothetical protein
MTGGASIYSATFEVEKKPDCFICGATKIQISAPRNQTLEEFRKRLMEKM